MGKRYCFFSAQYLPHMGGVENYTYNIAQELIKRGNEVVVVTNNTTNSCQHEYMGQIEVLRIPCFNFLNGRFPVMRLNTQFRKIDHYLKQKSFDIVIVNARFYLHSIYGALYAKKKEIPCICIEHGTSHLSVNNKILDYIGGVYEHMHTAVLKKICKNYYGVSKACCEWSGHFRIQSKGVLYNAVDLDRINSLKQNAVRDFRKENDIDHEAVIVVFTGRLLKEKGIFELIKAVEKYNQSGQSLYLLIAGDGPEKSGVEQHKSKSIIPLGRLGFPDIVSLLNQSDIFCLPSVSEGLATSALEAAACGCYIITTERGGTKELIATSDYGTVMKDNSVRNVYQALVNAVEDKEKRKKAQQLCYEKLESEFTWKHTADRLEKIVNSK